jgi:putative transposase
MSTAVGKWVDDVTATKAKRQVETQEIAQQVQDLQKAKANAKTRTKNREALKKRIKDEGLDEDDLTEHEKALLVPKKPKPHAKPKVTGMRRCRILLSDDAKRFFYKADGCRRFIYNRAVNLLREGVPMKDLDSRLIPSKAIPENEAWQLETPKDMRKSALKECITAHKAAASNLRAGNIARYTIGYRSRRKSTRLCVPVEGSAAKVLEDSISVYSTYLKDAMKLQRKESFNDYLGGEIKIIHERGTRKWYALIPRTDTVTRKPENQGEYKSVAIDPGERAFLTGLSSTGEGFAIGQYDMKNTIFPIFRRVDQVQSARDRKVLGRGRAQRIIARLRHRIQNCMLEVHHKAAKYLLDRYNIVILPHFGSRRMVESHRLPKNINRRLLGWSHYRFRERLKDKANKYDSAIIVDESEEYTTQTCVCGSRTKQGGREVYRCACGYTAPRDLHGAMMIHIKALHV